MGCGASKSKPSAAEGLPLVVDKAAAEPEPKLFTALSSTSPWNTVKVDSVPASVRSRKLDNPEPTDAALNPPAPPEEASSDASDAEGDGNFMMQQYTTSEDEDDSPSAAAAASRQERSTLKSGDASPSAPLYFPMHINPTSFK